MFSNLKAQFFHEAALESKVHQLGECSRLDECSVSSGCPVLRLDFRSQPQNLQHPCSSVPTCPTTELAAHFLSLLSLLADFPTSSTIAVSLAVESSTVAGDSSQLAPWSCQPVSMFVARIPASTMPEDVHTSAHVYQRAATRNRRVNNQHCSATMMQLSFS